MHFSKIIPGIFYGTERIQWNLQTNGDYVWKRTLNKQLQEQKYGSLQFNLNGQFNTGKLNHKLLVGADADYLQADTYSYQLQNKMVLSQMQEITLFMEPMEIPAMETFLYQMKTLGNLEKCLIQDKKTLTEFLQEEWVFMLKI